MTMHSRLSLPAICSGDHYSFNFVRIYFFSNMSFSIFFLLWVLLSLAFFFATDGRYLPSCFPRFSSLQILLESLSNTRPISPLLIPVLSRTASLTRSSRVKCLYGIFYVNPLICGYRLSLFVTR